MKGEDGIPEATIEAVTPALKMSEGNEEGRPPQILRVVVRLNEVKLAGRPQIQAQEAGIRPSHVAVPEKEKAIDFCLLKRNLFNFA